MPRPEDLTKDFGVGEQEQKRLLIVDDHEATIYGLRLLARRMPSISVAAVARDGREAMHKMSEQRIDVVCLDLSLGSDPDSFRLCRWISSYAPAAVIIVYTSFNDPQVAKRALAAGASGVVCKSDALEQLHTAFSEVLRGNPYISSTFQFDEPGAPEPLSGRQEQILQMLADGNTTRQIADELGLGVETVKTHISSILRKLNAPDRTTAVAIGLRTALIR